MSINQPSAAVLASASTQGFSPSPTVLTVEPGHGLEIPGGNFLLTAEFHRVGGDLLLVGKDGHEVVVRDYFSSHTPPDLISGTGGVIHSDLAARLAGAIAPGQWAQDGAPQTQLHAIGEIQKLAGVVKVHHVDGTVETLQQGATVFQGDVLETAGDGSVGIVFADRSTFSLGKNGRMVMDELVYDPQAHTGHSSMSVVQGTFSFVSGQIAKSAPDAMSVHTPVMTIGIRGTTVAGTAAAEGSQNTIALLSDDDGGVGQIVISTQGGAPQVMTQPNQAIQMSSAFQAPPTPVVLPPSQLQNLIPELHNVQDNRPAQPTTDPHINTSATSGNATAPSSSGQQGQAQTSEKAVVTAAAATTPSGDKAAAAPSAAPAAPASAEAPEAPLAPDAPGTVPSTLPSDPLVPVPTIPTVPVTPVPVAPVTPVPVAPVVPVPVAPTSTPAPVYVPPVNHTTTAALNNTTVASTITGSNGNYTLSGGNAETVYTESQQGTDILAHTNWTILANGNAATVALYELPSDYTNDTLVGTVLLYADTQASPDSSTPTLSLHNDGHGATIDLTMSSVNLAHVNSNGYLQDAVAQGFHHIVGTSGNDQFNYTAGLNLSLDGGGGVDTLSLHSGTTVNLTDSAMTGTGILSALNIESVVGSCGDDLFLMGSSAETIDGGGGQNTIDFHTQTTGVLVQLNGDDFGTASGLGIATDYIINIEVVVGSSGNDTLVADNLADSLYGGAGNDTIVAGAGNDVLDGGSGVNLLSYENASSGITLVLGDSALTSGTAWGSGIGTDLLTNFEVIAGSSHGDNFQLLSRNTQHLTGSVTLDGGLGQDSLFADTASNLSITLTGTTGTMTSGDGGSVTFYNFEKIAGGIGADVIHDVSGTAILAGSWFSQADADAMSAAAVAGTAVMDASGASQLAAANFEGESGNGHYLAYLSNGEVYREIWNGEAQTAQDMTPKGGSVTSFELSDNGREALYADASNLYFYNADENTTRKIGGGSSDAYNPAVSTAYAMSSDGHLIAYVDSYQTQNGTYGLVVANTRTGAVVSETSLGMTSISQVAFAANGQDVFVLNSAGALSSMVLSDDGMVVGNTVLLQTSGVTSFEVEADGQGYVYSTSGGLGGLYYSSTKNGGSNLQLAWAATDAAISANGQFIAYWSSDGSYSTTVLYDTTTKTSTSLAPVSGDQRSNSLSFSDDGHYLFLTTSSGVISEVNPYFSDSSTDLNTLIGGSHADTLLGGLDIASGALETVVTGSAMSVTLNAGNTLIAGSGNQTLMGSGGSDIFVLQSTSLGHVVVNGGGVGDNQVLDLSAVTANLFVDLRSSILFPTANELLLTNSSGATLASDYVSGVNNAIGGAGADTTLVGNQNANTLVAGSGASTTFVGHGGADQIFFGAHTNEMVITQDYHAETVYLDNVAGAVNLLTAEGQVGLETASRSGNDLIVSFNDSGGGGQTVFKNYYIDNYDTLQIIENSQNGGDGGIFVKSGVQDEAVSLIGATNALTSMFVMTGTSADDMLVGISDHMLFLGSPSAILGNDTSSGDDFFIYGSNNVVIGGSGTNNSSSSVYYGSTTAALDGYGITANLSAYYSLTVNDGASSGSFTNVEEVYGFNSTDYLVNISEIVGTNNGDAFVGGRYGVSGTQQNGEVTYRAGHGNNVIVNAGIASQVIDGNTIGMFTSGTYSTTTAVMADYSNSSTGITANLNDLENWETIVVGTGAGGTTLETVMLTGTVVHDSTSTDYLYGVTDIRGSAHSDVITASSLGSYIRSSLGNDTYIASSGNSTLDYSDAVGGLFISFSTTANPVDWTFADGSYVDFTLQAVGTTAYAMHDYQNGSGFTDVLNLTNGTFNDIRMSYDGGEIIGTGWNVASGITMDLQDLGHDGTGALIDMNAGTVSGWNGTSSILFQDVAVIIGTGGNDTFVLSASADPSTLIGGGGTETVSMAYAGWHTWTNVFSNGVTDTVHLSEGLVVLSGMAQIIQEIGMTSNSLLLQGVTSEAGNSETIRLDSGEVYWSDGEWMSINGTSAALMVGGSFVGSTGGNDIVASYADVTGMLKLDGVTASSATLELTDSAPSTINLSGTHYVNIETLQVDGSWTGNVLMGSSMNKFVTGDSNATASSGTVTDSNGNGTLDLWAGHNSQVLELGDSQFLIGGNIERFSGFSEIVGSSGTTNNSYAGTYTPDSEVVSITSTAALAAGIHTIDLSALSGPASVVLSNYGDSSLSYVGSKGINEISVALDTAGETYVLSGGNQDVVSFAADFGGSNLELQSTIVGGNAVLYNNGAYNTEVVLKGIDLVRFADGEMLVMGTNSHTAMLDVAIDETIGYLTGTGDAGAFTAQASEGLQTLTFDDGAYTAYLSVGYDPGYDSTNAQTGNGNGIVGTETVSANASIVLGSHIDLDIASMTSFDLMNFCNGTTTSGLIAEGGDLNLDISAGASLASGATAVLMENMSSDTGDFGHITGLDGQADHGIALSLDFENGSVSLISHAAISSTSSLVEGTTDTDYIVGGHGNQTLSGGGGADEILAVSGNDTVIVGDNQFAYLDGGSGSSRLDFNFSNAATIDLTGGGQVTATSTGGQHRADSVEHFDELDLSGSNGSTLVLNENSVYSASNASNGTLTAAGVSAANASHALIIGGTGGDVLDLTHATTAWTTGSIVNLTVDGTSHSYQVYTSNFHGTAESVYVDTHITVVKS